MPETENIVSMTYSLEQASSLMEQLAKAYVELEAQEDASSHNVQWKDIEGHFRHLESLVKKKLEHIEATEKEITEKKMLLAEREAAVIAMEQDLLDNVQELKDAAVSAIIEASDENAGVGKAQVVVEELTQFCERMDPKGLLEYVMENINGFSSVCRKNLPLVLGSASEPTRLVLDALEGFFPHNEMTHKGDDGNDALNRMRQSCLLLMEALSAFLAKADNAADNYLNPKSKQHAKAMADEWKGKFSLESTDAANGKSLEARAFLRLLVTFRIASEFDKEELCKYVFATAHHKQATEICHSLELSQKIPGIVDTLLKNGRDIEAANFILAFGLSESFPPVPILKTYLKEVRRKLQGNGDADTQHECNVRELAAVKAVLRCVTDYNLEDAFPHDTLQKRCAQLHNSVRERRRGGKEGYKYRKQELQQGIRDSQEVQVPVAHASGHGFRVVYAGMAEYPPAVPNAFCYPIPNQYTYSAQANDQRPGYYAEGDMATAPYSAETPTYSGFLHPPQHS